MSAAPDAKTNSVAKAVGPVALPVAGNCNGAVVTVVVVVSGTVVVVVSGTPVPLKTTLGSPLRPSTAPQGSVKGDGEYEPLVPLEPAAP